MIGNHDFSKVKVIEEDKKYYISFEYYYRGSVTTFFELKTNRNIFDFRAEEIMKQYDINDKPVKFSKNGTVEIYRHTNQSSNKVMASEYKNFKKVIVHNMDTGKEIIFEF